MISFSWSAGISVATSSTSFPPSGLQSHSCTTIEACLEYAILETRLLSTAAVIYHALLCFSFAAGSLQSLSVRLMELAAESLKMSDGSVLTAFAHEAN